MTDIDKRALDSLSVAPDGEDAKADPAQSDAGRDKSIDKRLSKNPGSDDAKLDAGLDESMDASDPPSSTQPGSNEPAASSGYDPEAEKARGN